MNSDTPGAASPKTQPNQAAPNPGGNCDASAPKEDFFAQLVKLKADFENFRKRTDREKPEYYKQGKADMLVKFLPIYDLLRKAHEDIQASHAETPLAKGMDMIFKEFEKIFKEEGVALMQPGGKPFDALRHEVLGTVEKEGAAEGEVAEVLQDGYLMGDRLLRAARVRIVRNQK